MHGNNPDTAAETDVCVFPVTGEGTAVTFDPYPVVRPYSNLTDVLELKAFTVPFRVAAVGVTEVAAVVMTAGGIDNVVKVRIGVPLAGPAALVAVTL